MIKLGANSVLFGGFDLETAMKHVAWAGFDGIELSAIQGMCEHLNLDTYEQDVSLIREMAGKYGLELMAIEEAALDEARLEKAFDAAAKLGIPVVNIGPGGKSEEEETWKVQVPLIQKMAERALEYGVTLCCKAHVGACIYNTPTTLRAMKEVPSKGFGVDMDPSHIYRSGENPVDALKAVISRVCHVHIRDCLGRQQGPGAPENQAPGRGEIDLLGYLKVLVDNGYHGPVNFEVIGAGAYELSRVAIIAAEARGYLNACLKAVGGR